ncbi:MAG TPA: formimidoylglutamate deiminase [Acidobacteriaceae bacterium]|jgi:formimidoylglutamate deiminase
MSKSFRPTLLYQDGRFLSGESLHVNDQGRIADSSAGNTPHVDLTGKALLPGFVNVHSHSFQRLIRGRAESRAMSGKDFWSWRNTMYQAAARLSPEDLYDVARMCFLEMVHAGITTVGEFHYLHNAPDGTPYKDPNLLAKQVIAAAQSVGLRIVLLRSAYLRSGYDLPADPGQRRFFEQGDAFLSRMADLKSAYTADSAEVRFGVAPHSIRAVPLRDLHAVVSWARGHGLPIHMHVAEQVAENIACQREYGSTPVELLAREGLLGDDFVAVHAIHLNSREIAMLAESRTIVCSCPTTERNLGDGIVPADTLMKLGVRHALGSDSQAQIDLLEDARELDYHLRLGQQQRAVLDQIDGRAIAVRLFECATIHGTQALQVESGSLHVGEYADMVSIDLGDISVAGHTQETLLSLLVFGANRSAIRDVVVNGKIILRDGQHPLEGEIIRRYQELYRRVWGEEIAAGSRH